MTGTYQEDVWDRAISQLEIQYLETHDETIHIEHVG